MLQMPDETEIFIKSEGPSPCDLESPVVRSLRRFSRICRPRRFKVGGPQPKMLHPQVKEYGQESSVDDWPLASTPNTSTKHLIRVPLQYQGFALGFPGVAGIIRGVASLTVDPSSRFYQR